MSFRTLSLPQRYGAGVSRTAAPPTEVGADQLADVVARLRRALRRGIRSDYPAESLPTAQVELLQQLAVHPGSRVNDLAGDLRLAPNSVSTLVAQLTDAGMLQRDTDPADRRSRRLSLTASGAGQLGAWQHAQQRMLAGALSRLESADRAAVLLALPALERLTVALDHGS